MVAIEILTLIFSFFGGLGGLIFVYQSLKQKIRYRQIWLDKIEQLAPSTAIDFFIEVLGSPIFVNSLQDSKQYVFIHDLFYVDAVTNLDKQVLMYSVTTRRENFNPILKVNEGGNPSLNLKLGKTTFAELNLNSGKIRSGLGNRRASYVEEYYLGNPGLYQTYAFSVNDAGCPIEFCDPQILNSGITDTTDPKIQECRKNSIINTYTIAAMGVTISDIESPWLGVNKDQVRIISK